MESLHASVVPPWEIGRPQPALMVLAQSGCFSGRVLEAGCGSGENGLMIAASCGLEVVGVDLDEAALASAVRKARDRGLDGLATFRQFDARRLAELGETFDTAVDALLFHALQGQARREYVAGLHAVLRPGGRLYVLCYSDRHSGPPDVPHKVSLGDIGAAFGDGWTIEGVRSVVSASNVHPDGVTAWLISCVRGGPTESEGDL